MKKILLTKGKFALVDDRDFEFLNQWRWQYTRNSRGYGYAMRSEKGRTIRMHRQILKAKVGDIIDHRNGNGLDNQRENIRFCSRSQNAMNRKIQKNNTSLVPGVWFKKKNKSWEVGIKINRKYVYLGLFKEKKEAIRVRLQAVRKYFGDFANTTNRSLSTF